MVLTSLIHFLFMKHYISIDTVNAIKKLYLSEANLHKTGGITPWSFKTYGVKFDGGSSERHYLEGPEEKITWFLLQL